MRSVVSARELHPLYSRVRDILDAARAEVARSVNTAQVVANWLIGQEIVEEEQRGHKQSRYGDRIIASLATRLQAEFGSGYSATNLKLFRQFYLTYPSFRAAQIGHTVRDRSRSPGPHAARAVPSGHGPRDSTWRPGECHPAASWSHYRQLLKVESVAARAFYEIETIRNAWSARELERQVNSLLFERLANSKDKGGLMKLATRGHEVATPADAFKDPVVIEFLGLPESPRLAESSLEQALIDNLQAFLLELGKGFAFLSRQERITLDGDHFYIDLVFYHTILKCHVLIDLKIGKLTHGDLGQLQFYVNYFDRERRTDGDNPTLGLILCTDKNDAVVRYTLGSDQQRKIFASRYKLHLPTEAELKTEIRRELKQLVRDAMPE